MKSELHFLSASLPLVAACTAIGQVFVTPLPPEVDIHTSGFFHEADISGDGSTMVFTWTGDNGAGGSVGHVFRWVVGESLSALRPPSEPTGSLAVGELSADGRRVVLSHRASVWDHYTSTLWDSDLGYLPLPNYASTISANGQYVAGWEPSEGHYSQHISSGGVMAPPSFFGDVLMAGEWVSDNGRAIAGWNTEIVGLVRFPLGESPEMVPNAFAVAFSGDGTAAGRLHGWPYAAFIWRDGRLELLSDLLPEYDFAEATGVSNGGFSAVGWATPQNGDWARRWYWARETGVHLLDDVLAEHGFSPEGYNIEGDVRISGDGTRVAGIMTHQTTGDHYLWAVTIPTPGFSLPLGLGLLGIRRSRRVVAEYGA